VYNSLKEKFSIPDDGAALKTPIFVVGKPNSIQLHTRMYAPSLNLLFSDMTTWVQRQPS